MNEELRFQLPKKGRRGRERIYMPNMAWLRRSILGSKQSCRRFINAGARPLRRIEFFVIHAECPRKERDEGPAGILLASIWCQDLVDLMVSVHSQGLQSGPQSCYHSGIGQCRHRLHRLRLRPGFPKIIILI